MIDLLENVKDLHRGSFVLEESFLAKEISDWVFPYRQYASLMKQVQDMFMLFSHASVSSFEINASVREYYYPLFTSLYKEHHLIDYLFDLQHL